jgi:hypothetical protein
MDPIFITHIGFTNLLDSGYVTSSMVGIITLTFFVLIVTLRRKALDTGARHASHPTFDKYMKEAVV